MSYFTQLVSNISDLAAAFGARLKERGFKTGGNVGEIPVKTGPDDFDWEWTDVELPDLEDTDHIIFNENPVSSVYQAGELKWNADEGTLAFGVDGGDIAIGKEVFDYFVNNSGDALSDGDIVSIVAISGNREAVDLTDATDADSADTCVGMVTQGASAGGIVRVTMLGLVHNLDTSAFLEGDMLYVDPANAGKLTNVKPSAPDRVIGVGTVVVTNANVGVVAFRLRNNPRVQDLPDVNGTPLDTNGQILVWDNDNGYWDATVNVSSLAVVDGANVYTEDATFTYHEDAATSQREALGLAETDSPVFAGLSLNGNFTLTDTVWDDLRFPAQAINPAGSTAPPAVSNTTGMLEFSGTVDNIIAGVGQFPHGWKAGSAVYPHLHLLFPTAASANSRWKLEYNLIPTTGVAANAYGTYSDGGTITVANPNVVDTLDIFGWDPINMTGLTESCMIMWRITRLAASDGADTDTSAIVLAEFDIHFEMDKLGTDNQFPGA